MTNYLRVLIGLCVIGATFGIVYVLESNTLAHVDMDPSLIPALKNFYNFMRIIGIFIGSIMIVIGLASKAKKNLTI